jgi:hypothetical protein
MLDSRARFLAVLDGQLYVGYHPAWGKDQPVLTRMDPATGASETLVTASVRNNESKDWERRPLYNIWSDRPRRRILYLAAGDKTDPRTDGLWEYNPSTREKRLVLPLYIAGDTTNSGVSSSILWSGANADGTILIHTRRGVVLFDPATDKPQVLMQRHPNANPLALGPPGSAAEAQAPANDLLNGAIRGLESPFTLHDGYLWFDFGRVSLDGKIYESFPEFRRGPANGSRSFSPSGLTVIDGGKRMMVSDLYGAWILDLRR